MKAALAAEQPARAEDLGRQAAANTQQAEAPAVEAQPAQVQVLQAQAEEEQARVVEEARAAALALAVVHQV